MHFLQAFVHMRCIAIQTLQQKEDGNYMKWNHTVLEMFISIASDDFQ